MVVMWHFTATGLVLFISTRAPFRAFKAIRLNPWQMLPVCAFFAGYVVLGNLSLTLNSIGFYQLSKVMTTPTVVLINFVRHWNSADTLAASASVPWHDLLRALSLELRHRRMAE